MALLSRAAAAQAVANAFGASRCLPPLDPRVNAHPGSPASPPAVS